ncbi:MAG: hypothetical protein AB1405_10965 [Bdellovibrionota bacterium]
MLGKAKKYVLADTGFWRALFQSGDQFHESAKSYARTIEPYYTFVPWPVLYETLNGHFVKTPGCVAQIDAALKRPGIVLFDDKPYRDAAKEKALGIRLGQRKDISLVDWVIRMMVEAGKPRIDYLVTCSPGDFMDVCSLRRVEPLILEDGRRSRR